MEKPIPDAYRKTLTATGERALHTKQSLEIYLQMPQAGLIQALLLAGLGKNSRGFADEHDDHEADRDEDAHFKLSEK